MSAARRMTDFIRRARRGAARSVRLPIPLLLPDVDDLRDACVGRLEALLAAHRGIERVHTVEDDGGGADLCLHYDPELATLADVERVARAAGATISERFRHEVLILHAIDGEDAARRVEADLESLAGVMEASVNLAAQRVRIEYDREWISLEDVLAALRALGYPADRPGAAKPRAAESWIRRNKELALSLVAGGLLATAWGGSRWLALGPTSAVPLYLASYGCGAWDLLRHWLAHLRKGRVTFDIDLLMLVAAVGGRFWANGLRAPSFSSSSRWRTPSSTTRWVARVTPSGARRARAGARPRRARQRHRGCAGEASDERGQRARPTGGADPRGRYRSGGTLGRESGAHHRGVRPRGQGAR